MKNLFRLISTFTAAMSVATPLHAQKAILDHDAFDSWKSVRTASVSSDGDIIAWEIAPQQGDGTLFLKRLSDGSVLEIDRATGIEMSQDGSWAFCRIKVPYGVTRQAKIEKKKGDKMPKDTLAGINLKDFSVNRIGTFSSYKGSADGHPMLAVETKDGKNSVVVVINPVTGRCDTLKNVKSYCFDKNGERLAAVFEKNKKDSLSKNEIALFRLDDMSKHVLAEGHKYYSTPNFNRSGDRLLFLASTDSAKTGNKHCALYMAEDKVSGRGKKAVRTVTAKELIPQGFTEGLPEGFFITEHSDPIFSAKESRILLGIAECMPPKDTTIVDFETAGLDIWNWDIYMTPPMQKVNAKRIASATCLSAIDLKNPHTIIPLGITVEETISPVCGGEADWALVKDKRPYQISGTWDSNDFCDVYSVSLTDGSRRTLFTKLNGSPSVSPCGKYLTWYSGDDLQWHSYEMATGREFNLTGGLDGIFYNDEDDHPDTKPSFDRPHWLENDETFLLADKYDIWKIRPDGSKAVNMTCGEGKAHNVQYRYTELVPKDITAAERKAGLSIPIGKKEKVWLTSFNRTTKEHGIASVSAASPGINESKAQPFSFKNIAHSFAASTVVYTKGNFTQPMDLYFTKDYWQTEKRLTDLKPQQDRYNWGNVQLVSWKAYDGTPLEGLLYTPENLDTAKKYPMIVYFYEKNSQELFSRYEPVPSRSIINFPFYTSRGYVVFVPDIVYKDGHPGESAYNCICAGAEAMCAQFGFIDRDKMGIQGQSWGGYQTAYLVTRTDMFAAAGSGAPVGNMTSAYGGIRWGSGVVRAVQYEKGQSRIGKSMWEDGGLELYIENSPVFHTENVTTPVLIMHNDGDGAVPWYQGIEFFMSLRRFGHPAWLLQYNGEEHNLVQRRNTKDLTRRLQQFFDHYLKGEPMPAWMKTGVPYSRKGQYFGFEQAAQNE